MRFDTSKPNEENAELLPYAFSKGINYFDTAPQYCLDKSEPIFGIAFKQMKKDRDKFYVSTKGMPTSIKSESEARSAVEKSLRRLNLEKLDFYYVWCIRHIEHYEMAVKKGGLYDGLLKCKEEGLIDHILISTHLPGAQVEQVLEKNQFEGVLMGLNVLNFLYRWQGAQAAAYAGLGVVAMNPLAGGLIPQHEKNFQFLASAAETPTQAAIRFCVSSPQINVALVGFTTKEHIDTACAIADSARAFTPKDTERIKSSLSENMNTVCTACGYCLDKCPQNIPVQSYMQAYNEHLLFGLTEKEMLEKMKFHHEWGLLVYNLATASECTQCENCETACTQHLDIIKRLEKMAEWEKHLKKRLTKLLNFAARVKNKLKRISKSLLAS